MYNRICSCCFTIQVTFDSISTTYFSTIHVDFESYSYKFGLKKRVNNIGIGEFVRK